MRRSLFLLLLVFAGCAGMNLSTTDAAPQSNAPECKMTSRGRQVCGYHCRMGSDGEVACANSADGVCAMGSDGRVTCTQVASTQAGVAPAGPGGPAPGKMACNSNIDCGSGKWCKDRGDGLRQCMGDEGRGDFCNGTIDCGPGLFCKPRGDGYQVCM